MAKVDTVFNPGKRSAAAVRRSCGHIPYDGNEDPRRRSGT